jgi:hypothetical protein
MASIVTLTPCLCSWAVISSALMLLSTIRTATVVLETRCKAKATGALPVGPDLVTANVTAAATAQAVANPLIRAGLCRPNPERPGLGGPVAGVVEV